MTNGLIGHSLYGAGRGKGTYEISLNKIGSTTDPYTSNIYSLIAGKVFGNTYVTMNGGRVLRNVYGGGNMGSVGKGNYAGGADDYSTTGYGETLTGNLWTPSEGFNPDAAITNENKPTTMADFFLSSGKTNVVVTGGTVGYINTTDPTKSMKNNLPYGNVFGGSAGEAAPNITESPRYLYCPTFFSGYVNATDVVIGATGSTGPTIYGSVYGGGQDGHVRRDTKVTINSGEIGLQFNAANQTTLGTDMENPQWLHRGNVYGAGSGISKYAYDFNYDGDTADNDGSVTYHGNAIKEQDYSTFAGSVTRTTTVEVKGGTIHRNVYGGGSMASVGAPKIGQTYDPYLPTDTEHTSKGLHSLNHVIIGGGSSFVHIGDATSYAAGYGGSVFGAGRGDASLDVNKFGTSVWTKVTIKDKSKILRNVFGGGDNGLVKKDAVVKKTRKKQ